MIVDKCLSVKQPWAWAIINLPPELAKDTENRTWATKYRGRVAIQAGKACTDEEYADAARLIRKLTGKSPPPLADLPRGEIIGTVEITDCTPADNGIGWGGKNPRGFHWHLKDPRPAAKLVKVRGWPGCLFKVAFEE
jgi:hypothetical protein